MVIFQFSLDFFSIEMRAFGPSIKFLWSFGFLSWLSAYVFITNSCLNGHVYISVIVLNILDKLIHDCRNVCECLTPNEMYIKLASPITCSITDNVTKTSSRPPPEVEKTVLHIVNLIILCIYLQL